VLAAASAFFWAVLFFGVLDLAVPIERTPGFHDTYLLETGWGVLYTFMVGGAFAALTLRPGMVVPLAQLTLVALCLAATAVAAGAWRQLLPALLLAVNCGLLAVLSSTRGATWRRRGRPRLDPVVGVVSVLLIPPAVAFSVDMVHGYREGRPPLDSISWGVDHWPTQGTLALAVAAVAVAVAAGVRARWPGTAASAACVAVSAGWFGFWSAVYPDHAGSAGDAWGIALLVWACAFAAAVTWRLAEGRARAGRRSARRTA
jgi:hypothetical protein